MFLEPAYKNAKIIAQVPSRWKMNPAYFHSFGLTNDKIIFVEQPYCFNLLGALSMPITGWSYIDCLKWHTGQKVVANWKLLHCYLTFQWMSGIKSINGVCYCLY
jgi:hypothetical protein